MSSISSKKSSKLALGLSLLIFGLTLLLKKSPSEISSFSFKEEPVRIEGLNEEDLKEEKKIPKRIVIPSLSIDLKVNRSQIKEGYWEVFKDQASWGEGSGLPGEKGNQVIFAHAREGLFLPLRSIKLGARIYILTAEDWFEYEVREIKEVYPNEVEVIAPTEDETLTLYTCSGFFDKKRLLVVAKRV